MRKLALFTLAIGLLTIMACNFTGPVVTEEVTTDSIAVSDSLVTVDSLVIE